MHTLHCSVYALSYPGDKSMRQNCDHAHTDCCGQCEALEELLDSIQHAIQEAEFSAADNRDEALYLFRHASKAICLWKCHQI